MLLAGGLSRVTVNLTISANTKNYNIFSSKGGTYVAGRTDIILTINSGIVVGSTSTATYSLDTGTGWDAGDTISIVNNGYIAGKGGTGGRGGNKANLSQAGFAGGPGFRAQFACTITNASGYIYSGGGGGGAGRNVTGSSGYYAFGGGGGAGNSIGIRGKVWASTSVASSMAESGNLTHGGGGGPAIGTPIVGGALNVAGQAAPGSVPSYGAGGGGGGASGGAAISAKGGHGVAIQGISNVTWISGNTRVYGGTAG